MQYEINYLARDKAVSPAFSYDADNKILIPLTPKVSFEQGAGEFQVVINGDYPFSFDNEGLLVGDLTAARQSTLYPRLDVVQITRHGIRNRVATITQNGGLITAGVRASDTLPEDALNLLDLVAIDNSGITTTKINEVWYLCAEGNYVCTDDQLIRVRL